MRPYYFFPPLNQHLLIKLQYKYKTKTEHIIMGTILEDHTTTSFRL
jgi:hypothetical protein